MRDGAVLPRQILPGKFWMITRRCTQRQFLLRPDDETNQNFLYVLALAAQRYDIDVILPSVEANHHHLPVLDRRGRVAEFYEYLHKLVAKAQNALRGRSENLWSSEPVSLVELVDTADVIDKVVYAATNPVKDGLVERVHHWPGVNGLSDLLNQRVLTIRRPKHFFSTDGSMPETVELRYVIPPELGDADEVRRVLRERVAAVEREHAVKRLKTGAHVLGRRAILRQSWRDSPTSQARRPTLRPRVAARDRETRKAILRRYCDFLVAYREARACWLQGLHAIFPAGTYWLRRFANVPVAPVSN